MSEWVWLEYPETGGRQRFHANAADVWRQKGWVDADPPEEPDPTKEPQDVQGQDEKTTTKTSRKRGATEQER